MKSPHHTYVLNLRNACDLVASLGVGDEEGVGRPAGGARQLRTSDVQAQVLEGGNLRTSMQKQANLRCIVVASCIRCWAQRNGGMPGGHKQE
jgi:hypothetical protein